MQRLNEEEATDVTESATPEDALAKLEGKAIAKEDATRAPLVNGSAHGPSTGGAMEAEHEEGKGLGIDGSANNVMNGTANGHVTA